MWAKMEVETKILPCTPEHPWITEEVMFMSKRVHWDTALVVFSEVLGCALKN